MEDGERCGRLVDVGKSQGDADDWGVREDMSDSALPIDDEESVLVNFNS